MKLDMELSTYKSSTHESSIHESSIHESSIHESSTHESSIQFFYHCLATAKEYKINLISGRTSFFKTCNKPTLHKYSMLEKLIRRIEPILEKYNSQPNKTEEEKIMLAEYFRQLAGIINIKRRKFKDASNNRHAKVIWGLMQQVTPANNLSLKYYTKVQQSIYISKCQCSSSTNGNEPKATGDSRLNNPVR